MTRISLTEELKRMLLGLNEPVELIDEQGLVVGKVTPVPKEVTYVGRECPLGQEELDRRFSEGGPSLTMAELRARLGKR